MWLPCESRKETAANTYQVKSLKILPRIFLQGLSEVIDVRHVGQNEWDRSHISMQFEQKTCWLGHTTGSLTYEYTTQQLQLISVQVRLFRRPAYGSMYKIYTRKPFFVQDLPFLDKSGKKLEESWTGKLKKRRPFCSPYACLHSNVMPSDLLRVLCNRRDIEVTSEAHRAYSGYSRGTRAIEDLIQHGGNFESELDGRVVEKPSCFLSDSEISPDSSVVPF